MSPTNLLTRSFTGTAATLGAVGLSAIAVLGMPEAAKAADIIKGTDYLYTPADGSTYYDFPFGRVLFKGVPTFAGGTDTVVERLDDCHFEEGMCEVEYIIRDLRLMSIEPVEIPDLGTYNVFVMLNDNPNVNQDPGIMKISSDGTYTSGDGIVTDPQNPETDWPVKWKATFEPLEEETPDFGPITGENFFDSVGMWSHEPLPGTPLVRGEVGDPTANCHDLEGPGCDPADFFIVKPVVHMSPNEQHTVVPRVPEPSATVPLALFGLAGLWGLKKKQSLK